MMSKTSRLQALVKLEDYVRGSRLDAAALLGGALAAGARDSRDHTLLDELVARLALVLGNIDEEETAAPSQQSTDLSWVDERSAGGVVTAVCAALGARTRSVEHLLARARDRAAQHTYAPHSLHERLDTELAELYRSAVLQLCALAGCLSRLCSLRVTVGAPSERVMSSAVRVYAALAALAKQIDVDRAHQVRFERLLKLSGRRLSAVTDNLITYLEGAQQPRSAPQVLRDTKLIPRLVLEAETYSKRVILLANKAKCNWQQYLSLGTARDFRIKAPVLQQALSAREQHDDHQEPEDMDINDAETEIVRQLSDVPEDEDEASDHALSDHDPADHEQARTKRRRVL